MRWLNRGCAGAALMAAMWTAPVLGQTAGMLSFQGLIKDAKGEPVNGAVNLGFRIYDAEIGGKLVDMDGNGDVEDICGEDVTCVSGVVVTDGIVSTKFGPVSPKAFDGNPRWLEVSVDGSPLSRLDMATAPAVSEQVNIPATGSPAITVDGSGNVSIPGTTQIGSSITIDGVANTVTSSADLELHVSSGRVLRLETNATSPNLIGGYSGNSIMSGAVGATISGGGAASNENRVFDHYGTVSGGRNNRAGSDDDNPLFNQFATVGGGESNTASVDVSTVGGGSSNSASGTGSTVGGGINNTASAHRSTVGGGVNNEANGSTSTVGGGSSNDASASASTVAGGFDNTASGLRSTVPGGSVNTAAGDYSFAAGRRAKANHDGAFVWADSTDADFASTAADQFLIRAASGVGINTDAPAAALHIGGLPGVDGLMFPDGTLQTTAGGGGAGNTLDESYDQGGAGAGRTITADSGAVNIAGPDGLSINGDVGIGTTTPSEKLDVIGNVHASGTITSGSSIIIDGVADTITSNGNLEFHVNDGRVLRLETNATSPNLIGGWNVNNVTPGVVGATISGGGELTGSNRVFDNFGTIGGGRSNRAGDGIGTTEDKQWATVGGGNGNTASGELTTVGGGANNTASGTWSTVAGGANNTASGGITTMGGGFANTASGSAATVGGGQFNDASGSWATVPGGRSNSAGGDYTFAAGRQAQALSDGMFVWADHSNIGGVGIDFPSATEINFTPAARQFLARATGGVVFVSAIDGATGDSTAGVELAAGGGSWSSLSDRNAKTNVDQVDGREILQRLRDVPIATWNYKAQDESIRHIGPMAQDFAAAFGVGEKETMITTIDADGVALAAIQGLYEIVQEKDCQIADLEARLSALEAILAGEAQATKGGGK